MGLLTKIFGNPEGGASTTSEPQAGESASAAPPADAQDPVISAYPRSDGSSSGIRPAVEAPPARTREPGRSGAAPRRPEHPRMYLRPTPAVVDPSVPGSTRRQQISVRPGAKETTRGHAPPPKRASEPHERSERPGSARIPERSLRRERPSEAVAAPTPRLTPASRPRTAMVVSPVSLTQEEVQPGARPKQPTLLGLGGALNGPQSHGQSAPSQGSQQAPRWSRAAGGAAPSSDPGASARRAHGSRAAERVGSDPAAAGLPGGMGQGHSGQGHSGQGHSGQGHSGRRPGAPGSSPAHGSPARADRHEAARGASAGGAPSGFDALALQASVDAPVDISASVQLLADFALKLSLGPLSRSWLPDVRRSLDALLLTGKHRDETALVALSTRLLELLPSEVPAPSAAADESACTDSATAPAVASSASSDGQPSEATTSDELAVAPAAPSSSSAAEAAPARAAATAAEAPSSESEAPAAASAGIGSPALQSAAPDATASEAVTSETVTSEAVTSEAVASEAATAEQGAAEPVDDSTTVGSTVAEATPAESNAAEPAVELAAPPSSIPEPAPGPREVEAQPAAGADSAPERAAEPETSAVTPLAGALRDRILHEVSRLAGVLPEWPAAAQDLAEEARRRETHVMRQLVAQVDGLRRDQRARLEEQMHIEELASMSPEAIAEEFDAPIERASELRRVLDGYREERLWRAPDVGNAIGLARAVDELERQCQAFDDCDPEQKEELRVLRSTRRQALSAVNLLLAERGEVEWLEQLEPLAIGERVERLKEWLGAGGERAQRA